MRVDKWQDKDLPNDKNMFRGGGVTSSWRYRRAQDKDLPNDMNMSRRRYPTSAGHGGALLRCRIANIWQSTKTYEMCPTWPRNI